MNENKEMEALEVYGNENNPVWLRNEAKERIRLALTEAQAFRKRVEELKERYGTAARINATMEDEKSMVFCKNVFKDLTDLLGGE